jgi:superfamily II DNA or RNA helicase
LQLRPYQEQIIAEVEKHQRPLVSLATGAGKTVIACGIIHKNPFKHILFFAHRRELIFQPRDALKQYGVEAGVILSGESMNRMARVQVASVQTLHSRCIRGSDDLPPADIVFVDEAHHVRARTYRAILDRYPDAKIIGLTATPCRRDGKGLGNVFEALVEGPSIEELIKQGHLVRTRVFAPSTPDLTGIATQQGDYAIGELDRRVNTDQLVGDIVSHWHRLGEGRKTVVFATSVPHSIHLAQEFQKSGARFEHLDGKTPKEERDAILQRLSDGELQGITNCMVLTEGFDLPAIGCIVLARPTKSLGLYLQMAGRALRPSEGKADALILDHSGVTIRHGWIEDPRVWYLDEDQKAESPAQVARTVTGSTLLECSRCQAVRVAGQPCRECGFLPGRRGEYHHVDDGELVEHRRDGSLLPNFYPEERKREFYAMLLYIGQYRGHKDGAAAHRFKDRFGHFPTWRHVTPISPDPEVIAWDRHCRIKYAKYMEARAQKELATQANLA